jgi:GTP cyclohydrolase II
VRPGALDGSLLAIGERRIRTARGDFRTVVLRNLATGAPVVALATGDVTGSAPLLARVHSSCVTSEAYGACDCDCADQLDAAIGAITAAGRGVIVYLMQEGRGAGFVAKARDRMLVQASGHRLTTFDAYDAMGLVHDQRRYDEVAAVCRLLGVAAPLVLLTNNPEKTAAVGAAGVAIGGVRSLPAVPSAYNRHYLTAKASAGHALATAAAAPRLSALPDRVEPFAPHALRGAPHLIRVASYLLPIGLEEPAWFRLHVYVDRDGGGDRVVLTHGSSRGTVPLACVQPDTLRGRFPLGHSGARGRWLAAADAIVRHGAGSVVFLAARGWARTTPPDAATPALLAAHLPGRARMLLDGRAETGREAAVRHGLVARGVRVGKQVRLGAA